MTSDDLACVPEVEIDPDGTFKYVLIKVSTKKPAGGSSNEKIVVRGFRWGAYHADIFEDTEEKVRKMGLTAKCLGGGRIHHNAAAKQLNVYGYSQGFGKADHEQTVQLLKTSYPDYEITWSNSGY
ncbi:14 kDa phosphohistidine phosphatase-like [Anabrus simplex]|uniref:14 kDa phosphohistidine phosphatase-like n=1 Tax=Anabrus simplex TaxID=316456 RepID=UPI0034DCCCCF